MTMIAMSFGTNGGFAINPARDLGPRLFTLCVGYGWEVFSAHKFYFWIPLVVPFFGALIGTWLYKIFVGIHGLDESIDISGAHYPSEYKVGGAITNCGGGGGGGSGTMSTSAEEGKMVELLA